ncbi:hypothetical protein W97_08731 [Coniosporium apollinis CBS 100218]|uniref:TATA-binding protein interacting (TIP20) domain-containing protein n=1 Tax=Coniosporium apollinis (strain CBS 100218) TaxID=1168221 RepID=R7Z6B1_CONA1|nr:uncharacterized protein W97_08731 [Coniosporium apollinis CBS 100218]EON69471.1 hypothetical protein W97_08731 [Coniosporium apollinis CBS 100218]
MASTAIPANPTAQNVAQLLPKLQDEDPDFRYMALNDLHQILKSGHPGLIQHDYPVCARVVDGLLHTLKDTNGEVQNMAVKVLEPFVNKAPDTILAPLIDKVSNLKTDNIVDSSIPALALRAIVVALPKPIQGIQRSRSVVEAYGAVSKALIPRLVGYTVIAPGRKDLPAPPKGMLEEDMEKGTDSNAMDVLIEVARCFGPMLQEPEIQALQAISFEILESERASSALKKKAVTALSTLATYFSDAVLSAFISRLIESLRDSHVTLGRRKLYITVIGSMARAIPRKFGPYLRTLAPFVFSALSAEELESDLAEDVDVRDPEGDEVREAALVAIENFLAACSHDMRFYTHECIDSTLRFLKYDPNLADDDDEDMDAAGSDQESGEEDFEEEGGYEDEDDASWKVRRCAAKALYVLVTTRSDGDLLEDGTLYDRVAPALISRFKEREESVRLEVLAALAALVRVTGNGAYAHNTAAGHDASNGTMGPPPSRKRRRGGSDASMFDSHTNTSLSGGYIAQEPQAVPSAGAQSSLSKLSPDIMRGVSQLLKTGPPPTKEASMALLRDMVAAQRGGLSDYLAQIIDPVVEAVKGHGSHAHAGHASSSTTANSLRIQALQLLGAIAETHTSKNLQPYLPKAGQAVVDVVRDKYSRVAVEALNTVEQFVVALTPPRSTTPDHAALDQLYDVLVNRIAANDADLEVRQRAIHVLGLLLGRTSGSQDFISQSKRTAGLDLLADRLRNELTRLAAVRAIDVIASLAQNKSEFSPKWVQSVCLELGAQLRKASRSLRGASLATLRTLAVNPVIRPNLDSKTTSELLGVLLPVVNSKDAHLLVPALVILTTFVRDNGRAVVDKQLDQAICQVVTTSLSGSALDALLTLVRAIGEQGVGRNLMQMLLKDVGVGGNPDLVGKVVGTLLVAGGPNLNVKLDDFVSELNTAKDGKRKCLALAVLGEAGLRMGSASPLQPQLFISYFSSNLEQVPLAAAVALGRAGAGSISTYLPVVLSTMSQPSSPQYLLLHSLKEILQLQSNDSEILPYSQKMWQSLVVASQAEDNKAIGAECIGRLAIIDPKTYLPQLQAFLHDPSPTVRGMVISALRYTFADTDSSYDAHLAPLIIPMLSLMLHEPDLENRRLALTAFSAAAHNKPELILPHLPELLPSIMEETKIKPQLVREVQMGPFKHKVDDGLELRKSAYETLYALLENSFSALSVPEFFDRVIAGIGDDHDIRILCNLMLSKLVVLAPDETRVRLDAIAEHYRGILATKPKESAVKQELERLKEASLGAVRVSAAINRALGIDMAESQDPHVRAWQAYWGWVGKEFAPLVRTVEEEISRERER